MTIKKRGVYRNKRTAEETPHTEEKFWLSAKKSLGQNFLKNPHIVNKIVEAGEIELGDVIIEIGPGTGALTRGLIEKIKNLKDTKVIAIEKDTRAIENLNNIFAEDIANHKLHILEADFLDQDLATLTESKPYKIIANIPYYITGAIMKKSLDAHHKPKTMVVLVQKEVALRMLSRDHKESMLSQSILAYGKPELITLVAKGNFVPAPKVDSAVVRISNISSNTFDALHINQDLFFEVLHAGFGHKRKKMFSNILEYIQNKKPNTDISDIKTKLTVVFKKINLDENIRAEKITHEQWKLLVLNISSDIL